MLSSPCLHSGSSEFYFIFKLLCFIVYKWNDISFTWHLTLENCFCHHAGFSEVQVQSSGTEGSALLTDNLKNLAFVVICKEKKSKMLHFPFRTWDFIEMWNYGLQSAI